MTFDKLLMGGNNRISISLDEPFDYSNAVHLREVPMTYNSLNVT